MNVHDNVAVAVTVSDMWVFNDFSVNVCHRHKSRSRSSERLCVPINLPNMNAVRKFLRLPEQITEN